MILLWENDQVHVLAFCFLDIVLDTRPVTVWLVVVDAKLLMGTMSQMGFFAMGINTWTAAIFILKQERRKNSWYK